MSNKVIAIIGPTSSGKSNLGIVLAKKLNTDIISVDSRQIYKNMNIGSGKVEGKLDKKTSICININGKNKLLHPFISEGVNHWMIDIADPKKDYLSAAEFQDMAYQIIFKILSQDKTPLLVGGTGLHMDAILEGFQFPKTSLKLREELENFSTEDLLTELKEHDPITYEKIDKNNRRRIVRAVESYLINRKSHIKYKKKKPNFKSIIIGIDWPRKELYERIDKRVDDRIKEGMIDEIEKLHKKGVSWKKLDSFGLEHRYISNYLQNIISKEDMIKSLKFKIHAFARRQLVWYRKNKKIKWLDAKDPNIEKKALEIVQDFIAK